MVFNKEKEIFHKAAGAGKGTVQHCIKTYCNAEKEENSHSSCHANAHGSVSTNQRLPLSAVVYLHACACMYEQTYALVCGYLLYDVGPHYHLIDPVIK